MNLDIVNGIHKWSHCATSLETLSERYSTGEIIASDWAERCTRDRTYSDSVANKTMLATALAGASFEYSGRAYRQLLIIVDSVEILSELQVQSVV